MDDVPINKATTERCITLRTSSNIPILNAKKSLYYNNKVASNTFDSNLDRMKRAVRALVEKQAEALKKGLHICGISEVRKTEVPVNRTHVIN